MTDDETAAYYDALATLADSLAAALADLRAAQPPVEPVDPDSAALGRAMRAAAWDGAGAQRVRF